MQSISVLRNTKFHLEAAYVYVCVLLKACFSYVYIRTHRQADGVFFMLNFMVGTGKIGPSHQAVLLEFDFISDVVCRVATRSPLKLFIYPYIYMAIIIILYESLNG